VLLAVWEVDGPVAAAAADEVPPGCHYVHVGLTGRTEVRCGDSGSGFHRPEPEVRGASGEPLHLRVGFGQNPDGPDGGNCRYYSSVAPLAAPNGWQEALYLFRGKDPLPPCPGAEAEGQSPELLVLAWWQSYPLPDFAPEIDPGCMIVGLSGYLETGGRMRMSAQVPDTPFGVLDVDLVSTFRVDWGDRTRTGPHHDPGGEYPDGTITHAWSHDGLYDVVVRQVWTGYWRFGGYSGALPPLPVERTIDDFEVVEIEAVITNEGAEDGADPRQGVCDLDDVTVPS